MNPIQVLPDLKPIVILKIDQQGDKMFMFHGYSDTCSMGFEGGILTSRECEVVKRNIYKDMNKNDMPVLLFLAKNLKVLNYRKMKKQELVSTLTPLITFE